MLSFVCEIYPMAREVSYRWRRDPIILGWIFLFGIGFTAIVGAALSRGVLLENWEIIFLIGVVGPAVVLPLQYFSRK
jgi:hypothetical protein